MRFNSVREVVGSAFSNMSTGFVAQDDFHFVKVILFAYTVFKVKQIQVSLCRHVLALALRTHVVIVTVHHPKEKRW